MKYSTTLKIKDINRVAIMIICDIIAVVLLLLDRNGIAGKFGYPQSDSCYIFDYARYRDSGNSNVRNGQSGFNPAGIGESYRYDLSYQFHAADQQRCFQ